MAQLFPTSPEIVYNTLVADAGFMASIGTYEWKAGGSPVSAISIVTPGSDLPSIRNVSGVECVIHDIGDARRKDYYNSSNIHRDWCVYLICWEPSTGEQVNVAVERALQIFKGSTATEVVATPDGLGARVQTMIKIPSEFPIIAA